MAIKVGAKTQNKKYFLYSQVIYDKLGWVDVSKFLPQDHDLMFLKTHNGAIKSGWLSNNIWDGLKLENGDKVTHWKRHQRF